MFGFLVVVDVVVDDDVIDWMERINARTIAAVLELNMINFAIAKSLKCANYVWVGKRREKG